MTEKERIELPVGAHYYKAVYDNVEYRGNPEIIGMYVTKNEAVQACKEYAKDLEMVHKCEFDIWEYRVTLNDDRTFRAEKIAMYTHEYGFHFKRYWKREE